MGSSAIFPGATTPPTARWAVAGLVALLAAGACGGGSSDGGGGGAGGRGGGGGGAGGGTGSAGAGLDSGHGTHQGPDAGAGGAGAGNDGGPQDAEDPPVDMAPIPPPTAEAIAIAGQLHGAFLRLDCVSPEIEDQFCLPEMKGMKRVPLRFGGQAGKSYTITLRVWGVMEAITYRDGMEGGKHFYIGGRVGTPMTAEYALEVGAQKYYFNHLVIGAGEHYTYGFTYLSAPITIAGAASMTLYVSDPDNFINTNHMQSEVEDITAGLQEKLDVIKAMPLQGQFIYLEVASAAALP